MPKMEGSIAVSDIVAKHDHAARVRESIKRIPHGHVIPSEGLRVQLQLCNSVFYRVIQPEDFAANRIKVNGKTYWGAARDIAELRKALEAT
jgi:hypothetical protein